MSNTTVESSTPEEIVPQTPLQEQLMGLLSFREQCEAELADLDAARDAKKAELTECEAVLRAAKLIGPKTKAKPKVDSNTPTFKLPTKDLVQPRPWPEQPKVKAITEKIIAAIEEFDGAEFQIQQLSNVVGHNRKTVERAIGVMNGEGRIRILGRRRVIGRNPESKGGCPALTFKEIKD